MEKLYLDENLFNFWFFIAFNNFISSVFFLSKLSYFLQKIIALFSILVSSFIWLKVYFQFLKEYLVMIF